LIDIADNGLIDFVDNGLIASDCCY